MLVYCLFDDPRFREFKIIIGQQQVFVNGNFKSKIDTDLSIADMWYRSSRRVARSVDPISPVEIKKSAKITYNFPLLRFFVIFSK